jgi:hypothetical protein
MNECQSEYLVLEKETNLDGGKKEMSHIFSIFHDMRKLFLR